MKFIIRYVLYTMSQYMYEQFHFGYHKYGCDKYETPHFYWRCYYYHQDLEDLADKFSDWEDI